MSATIHLANRDWDALIDDFIALGFLPAGCDRGVIIPGRRTSDPDTGPRAPPGCPGRV